MEFEPIISYLAGEASTNEKKELENWLAQSEDNKAIFKKVKTVWEAGASNYENLSPDLNQAWNKINPENRSVLKSKKAVKKTKRLAFIPAGSLWRSAAMIVLALGLTFIFLSYYNNAFFDKMLLNKTATIQGEKKEITLADGTKVWLNNNTKLWYPDSFEKNKREIYLEGEAFFEVSENKNKPFIINTYNTVTKVLGTSFNLNSYQQSLVSVVLVTGKVLFENKSNSVVLNPGEKAEWNEHKDVISKTKNKDINFLAWKTQNLVFETSDFQSVINTLENFYKVKLEVENSSILECKFTGTFTNPKIEELLEIFKEGAGISYTKTKNGYQLSGPGCK